MFKSLFGPRNTDSNIVERKTLSNIEQFLLSLFLKPRQRISITGPGWGDLWASKLGRRPELVIEQFIQDGLLHRPDIAGLLSCKFRVPELAELCKHHELSAKGKKDEIIARLITGLSIDVLSAQVSEVDALVCTVRGTEIGGTFKATAEALRNRAEEEVFASLQAGRLQRACEIVFEFEASQPLPRGMGVDWSRADYSREIGMLEKIFEESGTEKTECLAAAQAVLWGTSADRFLPKRSEPRRRKTPEEKAAELSARKDALRAMQRQSLESYKGNRDVLVGVSIFAAGSSCDHCKAMGGDYSIEDVPILPHEGCTHEMGCRCCYAPLTEFSERVSKS